MPIRDIVLAMTILGSLPFCLTRPWIGILMWSWIGYMNPHRLTWGFAYGLPWAMLVAVATLAGLAMTKDQRPLPWTREVLFLLAFWAWMTVTTVFANYPDDAWEQWIKISKIYFMTLVGLLVMQEHVRVRLLVAVMALSIGFYGAKGGIFGLQSGGSTSRVLGPEGSFISGNTEIGLAFCMALPLLVFVRREVPRAWMRHSLTVTIALTVVATIFTYSRGAALALGIVVFLLFFKSRRKFLVAGLLLVGLWALYAVVPESVYRRVDTIRTYDADRSAMGRIEAWRMAMALAADRPLVGGGFRTFTKSMFERYGFTGGRDAHSIYFQVLGEHGYVGLMLYLGLIVATMVSLRGLARKPQADPARQWIPSLARMVEVSMIAYLVGGAFLSRSYFDYFYGLVALTVLMRVLDRRPTEAAAAPLVQAALTRQPGRARPR